MTFLHWPFPPGVVQRLLPDELEVDTFDGQAWVGVVAFWLQISREGLPYLPWVSRFPETNVRTYVRTPDGVPAVWFLSLDAARFGAAVIGRWYGLPYTWSRMRVRSRAATVAYESRRRWPVAGPALRLTVEVADPLPEPNALDRFLTDRWALFARRGGRLGQADASHPPWPLRKARVLDLEQDLVQAAGLPAPAGAPLALHSPGVAVRVSRLQLGTVRPCRDPSSSTATT